MRALVLLAAALLAGLAGPASASPSVTLNGVPIDGATDQRFENCTVVIDEKGDVHIEAKGYAVKGAGDEARAPAERQEGAAPAPGRADAGAVPEGKVSRRYFLVTSHPPPGTQFDLAIFINAQWIREVKASEPQVVMEITRYLRPGPNKVTLAATRRAAGERPAPPSDAELRVVIGEGNVGGGHVMIDAPIVEMARTAAETDRTEEFVVEAR